MRMLASRMVGDQMYLDLSDGLRWLDTGGLGGYHGSKKCSHHCFAIVVQLYPGPAGMSIDIRCVREVPYLSYTLAHLDSRI